MIEISNKNLFGKVIADALVKVDSNTGLQSWEKMRWVNAIAKAAAQIEDHGAFMTWQEENETLLIWSDKSNNIYETNGVCQCKAFEMGQPCWHRSAKKLYINYLAALENLMPPKTLAAGASVDIRNAPYLPNRERKTEIVGRVRI